MRTVRTWSGLWPRPSEAYSARIPAGYNLQSTNPRLIFTQSSATLDPLGATKEPAMHLLLALTAGATPHKQPF